VGLFADENEDAWSVLEAEHPGDATDVLKAYARVAKRASRDLIDASQAPATNEAIQDEDEHLAKQSDGDIAKRCREAASEIVGFTGRQTETLQKWHSDLQCVAKHDDDDEPPMRLGGDRAHALGRHQGLGGLTRAGCSGYGERLVWDGEDASRALLRVAAKNVPLKHVRKAVAEAVGEEEAGALASDEAIRVSGLSQGGWGSRKRGRLALGKVRAAAAAAPVPPAAATSGAADPRARRAARGAAAAGMLPGSPRAAPPPTGFSADPSAPPPVAPPADPRARKRRAKVVEAPTPVDGGVGEGFSPPPPATDEKPPPPATDPRGARDPRRKRRKG